MAQETSYSGKRRALGTQEKESKKDTPKGRSHWLLGGQEEKQRERESESASHLIVFNAEFSLLVIRREVFFACWLREEAPGS